MTNTLLTPQQALILRLVVGLVFGLGIASMSAGFDSPNAPLWMRILTPVLILGAFIIWAGAAAMRRLSLAAWSVMALGLIALVAWNTAVHNAPETYNPVFANLAFLIYPFLFIAHMLVTCADEADRPIAPFSLYFDQSWKHGVQLALAVLFTALFWAILWLGSALLKMIGFDWLKQLLESKYFAWPASGLAMACAVHLGDVQIRLMHSFRALVLGVLSWLLPVITVIGVIFAVSLGFSGLEPLWKTKAATASLLAACVALVLLINAAYQQGDEERPVHIVLKWAVRLACFLVLIFSALAAYSLGLRIAQYGLTPERVMAAVGVVIAVLYGIGYPVAAVLPGRWMQRLETVNIALAFVMAAVFLVVLTPVADPLRLSADSQASRVQGGAVTPDKFDWRVLRYETGTYGHEALMRLGKDRNEAISRKAAEVIGWKDDDRWDAPSPQDERKLPDANRLTLVGSASAIPASFLAQDFAINDGDYPDCLRTGTQSCYAGLLDLGGSKATAELLILDDRQLYIFEETESGWRSVVSSLWLEPDAVAAFKAGKLSTQAPKWQHVKIGDTVKDLR